MRRLFLSIVLASVPLQPLFADPAALAREASEALAVATASLAEADGASDRIAALTRTVRGFEDGLAAMRASLRDVVLEERETEDRLRARTADLAALSSLLGAAERMPEARLMLHPEGPLASARAAMLSAEILPALEALRANVASDAARLKELRTVQSAGLSQLEDGARLVRQARVELADSLRARTAPPPALSTDAAALEALINSSETLAAFADSLVPDLPAPRPFLNEYALPVSGALIGAYGDEGRPGWTFATPARALLTSPADATIRFAGTMPGQGDVLILEPSPGQLVILTGLGESLVSRGQIVARGEPIGFMPGASSGEQENLIESDPEDGQSPGERLYMEIRQGQAPVDPSTVFRTGEQ